MFFLHNFQIVRLVTCNYLILIIKMKKARYLINQPDHYMADPSAHVFNGKIYIYPSHDVEAGIPENDNGDHFDMRDYHVFSMEDIDGEVIDHGVVLSVKDIPWAGRQLWDSDVAEKDGKYYLYFSLKDKNDVLVIEPNSEFFKYMKGAK